MISKLIFIMAHEMGDLRFYSTYKSLMRNQWRPYEELKNEQEKQLRHMINFVYHNIPYYHKLLDSLHLRPDDIRKKEDLQKLPIITKEVINKNWDDFKPLCLSKIKYYQRSTGGSTGTPFKYRLEKFDRFLGGALMYRGWGYAGYGLGDRMVFFGGSSLRITTGSSLSRFSHEISRNIRMLSSFDMDEENLIKYVHTINKFRPKFMYGYASSFYFFAKWLEQNGLEVHAPKAIFTTAEKLFPNMRKKIEDAFRTEVYDAYGLNDGGVSACECSEHLGLHIDMERAIMEVVDENGDQIESGQGRIIATSLHNHAMPFIRYDTGDIGHVILDICGCGRQYKLLKEVVGRQQEILSTPDGKHIHGEFFTHIFWEIDGVKEFQVIQRNSDRLIIRIVPDENFDKKQLEVIKEIIRKRSELWQIDFEFPDKIERTRAGKYKFVIKEISGGD